MSQATTRFWSAFVHRRAALDSGERTLSRELIGYDRQSEYPVRHRIADQPDRRPASRNRRPREIRSATWKRERPSIDFDERLVSTHA